MFKELLKSVLERSYLDISPELKCSPVHLYSITPAIGPQFLVLFEKAQFGGPALMEEVCGWHTLWICSIPPLPACSLCSLCTKEMKSAIFLLQLPDTMPSHHMSSTLWNCKLKQTVPSPNCFWSWSFIKTTKSSWYTPLVWGFWPLPLFLLLKCSNCGKEEHAWRTATLK